MDSHNKHIPALLSEVLEVLSLKAGKSVLDCTLGLGGHTECMLQVIGKQGSLVALDADGKNIVIAKQRLATFAQNVSVVHANFRELPQCLPNDHRTFDAILADLGLSSPHIDDPARGFSFRGEGPLDMRYDTARGFTAAEFLEHASRADLTHILRVYGELPFPQKLAQAIQETREEKVIATSADLVCVVQRCYGYKAPSVLPQVFQALRIAVNDELSALRVLLQAIPSMLRPGGRVGIISYHSLEDRIVKQSFKALVEPRKDTLTGSIMSEAPYILLTKRPITASNEEIARNPRARSAKLRALARR